MFISLIILLAGCKPHVQEITITDVVFSEASATYEFSIDEFLLEDIELTIKYSDNSMMNVPLTREMISTADFELLLTSGEHLIEVTCEGKKIYGTITLTQTAIGQNRLPLLVVYDLVTEHEGTFENVYYTAGEGTFISFQLQYQYNPEQVSDVQVTKAEGLTGSFVSNVSEGLITITYSQSEPTNDKEAIFTISYTSDEKYNNFTLDSSFNNSFYGFDEDIFEIKSLGNFSR